MTMSHRNEEHFRQILRDATNPQRASEGSSARKRKPPSLQQTPRRKKSSRTPQFNVTITDRKRLDALSKKLGLARSAVINLALAELATKHGL